MKNETTYQTVLGRLIVKKRQEMGIDQKDMARSVGVSRSTWSRIEAGLSALNMDQLASVARKLEIPLSQLMVETDLVVEKLEKQNIKVHDSRSQVASKSSKIAPAIFLGGAVLGGLVGALLASSNLEDSEGND